MTKIDNCYQNYLAVSKLSKSPQTVRSIHYVGRSFFKTVDPSTDIKQITTSMIRTWLSEIADKHKSGTVRTYGATMKAFFNWCVAESYLDHNPIADMKLPKYEQKSDKDRAISDDERDCMLRYTYWRNKRNFAFICLLSSSGARMGAICNLRLGDLDLANCSANAIEKGGVLVTINFNRVTARAIQAYLDERPAPYPHHDYLWVALYRTGYPRMHYGGMNIMLKRVAKSAGIARHKHISGHMFRHKVGQDWSLNPDIAPVDTQNKLNHASFETTYKNYYARHSRNVASQTEQYDFLPDDLQADLLPTSDKIIKFPKRSDTG